MNKVINPTAGIILVILAIVFGFLVMGSPAKQRILRMDEKRVSDLQSIQSQIINFWQQKEKLPNNLVELSNPMSGYSLPIPPNIQNGEVYEYAIKDKNKLNFQLCATFALPMPKGVGISLPTMGGINESWNHDVGRTCYDRTIDKEIYPPFEKTKK